MDNIKEIRYRIRTVKQTRQITKAMHMISAAKMHRAMQQHRNNEVYLARIHYAMMDILAHTHHVDHPFLNLRDQRRAVYVVIAADKGLAGSYNGDVLKTAERHMEENHWKEISLFTVGYIAREFFEKHGRMVDIEFVQGTHGPSLDNARKIAWALLDLYEQDHMDEVYIVSTRMINSLMQQPLVERLLPLSPEEYSGRTTHEEAEFSGDFIYQPSPNAVLDRLVPQFVIGQVYAALVEAQASECSARMRAMGAATDNADEMIARLTLHFNQARQAAITQEISEVIAAAGVLAKDR